MNVNCQLIIAWNDGLSSSPAVDIAPDQGWRVAEDSGSYVLVRDEDVKPVPGETLVVNGVFVAFVLIVNVIGAPVVVTSLPASESAALALS